MTINGLHVRDCDQVLRCCISNTDLGGTLCMSRVREATSAVERLNRGADYGIGAILITGSDPNFCTGGNIDDFAAADDRGVFVRGMAEEFHRFVLALISAPLPVVAAVRGWAAGAGMSIACAADIVVGGPETKFRPAYPAIGFSPDGGMSWTLPRIIGLSRARDLVLTDRVVKGADAYRMGLLTRLVSEEDIGQEAEAIAAKLATGPKHAHGHIKQLLRQSSSAGLSEQLAAEAAAIAECADSPAGRAGVDAFVRLRHGPTH